MKCDSRHDSSVFLYARVYNPNREVYSSPELEEMDAEEMFYNWSTGTGSTPGWKLSTADPSFNLTGVRHAKTSLLLYDVLIPLLGSLILVLNLVVVVSVALILLRSRAHNTTTYLFLGNMAAMDCITGIAVLFGQFYPKQHRGEATCVVQMGLIVSTTIASVWSVGLIAVDRFLYIVHGIKYNHWMTMTRARGLIVVTWIIGCVVGFLPATGWRGVTNGGRVCWFIRLAPPGLIMLTTAVGVIPLLLVVVLYSLILYQAIKKVLQLRRADADRHAVKVKPPGDETHQRLRIFRGGRPTPGTSSANQWKATKIVLFTAGSFVATWLPYFMSCCVYVACKASHPQAACKSLEVAIAAPLAILGFLNSLLNPLIYAWWHTGFRGLARRIWCSQGTSGQRGTTSRTTTKTSLTTSSSNKTSENFADHDVTSQNEVSRL